MSKLRVDTIATTDDAFEVDVKDLGNGYKNRTVSAKLDDTVSVKDYASATEAVAQNPNGGVIHVPNNTPVTYPAVFPKTMFEVEGASVVGNVYGDADASAVTSKLMKSQDQTNHVGKEGYTLLVEARPLGSTDGSVPGSDFGIGVSAVKKNWTTSNIEGQVCGINTVTRGGYFLNAVPILGISKAAAAVVTVASHNFTVGQSLAIQNVNGMVEMNSARRYTVTAVTPTTITLSVNSTAFGTYTSGGIVHLHSGVDGFYTPGDTASYIANTVQSSCDGFGAILEGASYYAPGGSFIPGTRGIRVQLGAIKHTENLGIGVLTVAESGQNGAAFQAQNSRGASYGVGTWAKAFSYIADLGAGAYEAFQINQLGQIVLSSGPGASTPTKIIRTNNSNGSLEVVNHAGNAVILTLSDSGSLNLPMGGNFAINNQQVVGPRIGGYGVTGTISRGNFNIATADLAGTKAFLGAVITDLLAHGLLGA